MAIPLLATTLKSAKGMSVFTLKNPSGKVTRWVFFLAERACQPLFKEVTV